MAPQPSQLLLDYAEPVGGGARDPSGRSSAAEQNLQDEVDAADLRAELLAAVDACLKFKRSTRGMRMSDPSAMSA